MLSEVAQRRFPMPVLQQLSVIVDALCATAETSSRRTSLSRTWLYARATNE